MYSQPQPLTISERAEKAAASLAAQYRDGLRMFRAVQPLPGKETWPNQVGLFDSTATEILLGDGNRSSKSMCAAALFAAIFRDVPVTTWDGRQINCRMKHQRSRPLTMWVVGLQLNHIGQTIYRLLFEPGAYKIIQDKKTGIWRAWMPWYGDDADRWDDTRPSYPLIPESEIEGFDWESQSGKEFKVCTHRNGSRIFAYASSAEVKMGDPVDFIWIDEKMWFDGHYAEYRMRLIDRMGRMLWSTMPRPESEAWRRVKEVAEMQFEQVGRSERKEEDRHVQYFRFTMSGNPFHSAKAKAQVQDSTLDKDDLALRDAGEDITGRFLCYPHYDEILHSVEGHDDSLHEALRKSAFTPPASWTHELILDPGSSRGTAVLLAAVPPRDLWGAVDRPYYVPYKELYELGTDADKVAERVREFSELNGITFRRFIIDGQAGRQTALSFGIKVGDNISRAFRERGLLCTETADRFTPGSPDFAVRSEVINRWLSTSPTGIPRLRIVRKACPNLCRQMAGNMRVVTGVIVQNKEARQINDMRHTLEYWASRNPQYHDPVAEQRESNMVKAIDDRVRTVFGKPAADKSAVHMGPGAL